MLENFRSILHQKISSQQTVSNLAKFNLQKSKSIDDLNSKRIHLQDTFKMAQLKDAKQDTISYRSSLTKFNQQKSKQLIESIREMRQQVHMLIHIQQQKQGIEINNISRKYNKQQANIQKQVESEEQKNQKKIIELEEKIEKLQQLLEEQRQQINNLRNILIQNQNAQQQKQEENIKNLMDIKTQYTQIIQTLKLQIDRKNQQIHHLHKQNKTKYNQINLEFFQINEQDKRRQQDYQQNQNQLLNQNQQKNNGNFLEQQIDQQNDSNRDSNNIEYQLDAKKSEVFALQQQINGLLRAIEDVRYQLRKSQQNLNIKINQMDDLKNENENLEYNLLKLQQDRAKNIKIIQQVNQQLEFYKKSFSIIKESDQFSIFLQKIQQKLPESHYLLLQNNKIISSHQKILNLINDLKINLTKENLQEQILIQQIEIANNIINQIQQFTIQIIQRDTYIQNEIHKKNLIQKYTLNKQQINNLNSFFQSSNLQYQQDPTKIQQIQKQNSQLKYELNKIKLDKSINSQEQQILN